MTENFDKAESYQIINELTEIDDIITLEALIRFHRKQSTRLDCIGKKRRVLPFWVSPPSDKTTQDHDDMPLAVPRRDAVPRR